jgi:hypothetical protein
MVKIIAPGSTQLRTKAPTARKTTLPIAGKVLEVAGGTVSKLALGQMQKMKAAKDYKDTKEAELKVLKKHQELTERMRLDVDNEGDLTSYNEDLLLLNDDVASGIGDPVLRSRVMSNLDLENESLRISLRNQATKHTIRKGIAAVEEKVAALTLNFAATGDEATLQQIEDEYSDATTKAFYTADDAQKFKATRKKQARRQRFLWELNNNFRDVEANLKSNAYGLDIEQLKNAKSLFNTEKHRIWNEKQEQLDQIYFQGDLTDEIVDLYVDNKFISSEMGTVWKKAIRSVEAINPDPFVFNSMLERAARVARIGGVWKNTKEMEELFKEATLLRMDIMKEVGRSISKKQGVEILEKMGERYEKFEPYKEGILELKGFVDRNYTPQEKDKIKQELYRNFMDLVKKGVDPVEAIKKAREEYINTRNPEAQKYEVGQVYDTPFGAIKVIGFDEDGEPIVDPVEVK